MNTKLLLIAAVAVVLLAGVLLLANKSKTSQNTAQTTQKQNLTPEKSAQQVIVNVTANGFEPKDLKIKKDIKVVWLNKSGNTVTVNSYNHPTHLLYPFLNLGEFADGSSVSVVFDKPGVYTYHNHLNAGQTGTVSVE